MQKHSLRNRYAVISHDFFGYLLIHTDGRACGSRSRIFDAHKVKYCLNLTVLSILSMQTHEDNICLRAQLKHIRAEEIPVTVSS